jgi:uncharacterized membrane protein YbhN (UPF0104 family)
MAEVSGSLDAPRAADLPVGPERSWVRWTFSLALKFSVSTLLIYAIIDRIQITEIHAELRDIYWPSFVAGLFLTLPNVLVQHYKWRYLVRIIERTVRDRDAFASLMCGFSMGLVTPGRLGEIGRGLFIAGASKGRLTGMAIIDKVLSQWSMAFLGLTALLYLAAAGSELGRFRWAILGLSAVFSLSTLVVLLRADTVRSWIRSLKRLLPRIPYRNKVFAVVDASEEFRRRHLLTSVLYAFAFQFIILAQFYCFINAFDALGPLDTFVGISAAMFIKSLLPIALMDLGVREGAVLYFLGQIGVPSAPAFNASIMIFLSNVLVPGAVGVYYVIRHYFGPSRER